MEPENIIVICDCDLRFVTFVIAVKIKFFTQTIECVLIWENTGDEQIRLQIRQT